LKKIRTFGKDSKYPSGIKESTGIELESAELLKAGVNADLLGFEEKSQAGYQLALG
jgi:hypothetical protein